MLVAGFISRDAASATLSRCPAGSFLLRFSYGEPGELVVAFVADAAQGIVEQCYLRAEGEVLDERAIVDRLLANPWLRDVLDPATDTLSSKELFRPRGRYHLLTNHFQPPPGPLGH
jgi:hypothetical protein